MGVSEVLMAAHKYAGCGLSVIPIRPDGSKAPALREWKSYQNRHPSQSEIEKWFGNGKGYGIAIITGAVSGNLEVLDFDEREVFAPWCELVESNCPGLIERLMIIETPAGGYHIYFRSPIVEGNLKLARRALDVPEVTEGARNVHDRWIKIDTMIETRGEGGYALAPPSPAACHPDNRPYRLLGCDLPDIPSVTIEERGAILSAARSFNEYVEPERIHQSMETPKARPQQGTRPGDVYNALADWPSLLTEHGWKQIGVRGGVGLWQRPGKSGPGISATTSFAGSNLLYIFSTNASPFEPDHAYTPFAAYSLLKHGGNFTEAAKELVAEGYHSQEESTAIQSITDTPPSDRNKQKCDLPEIDAYNHDLPRIAEAAWDALKRANERPFLFRYGDLAIRIENDDYGAPVPKRLIEDRLRYVLARSANWHRADKEGNRKPALPPMHVVRDILATPSMPLPTLTAIIGSPTFAADGTLHTEPGYNSVERSFYAPHPGFNIDPLPLKLTRADIEQARNLIFGELLGCVQSFV